MPGHSDHKKNRLDFVECVVEEVARKVFSDEVGQYERRQRALDEERIVRQSALLTDRDFKAEAKKMHKKASSELSRFNRSDIERWISESIDDEFVRMCDAEQDKEFVNIVISNLIWNHSKKISGIQKLYYKKWLRIPHLLEIKWKCSNCRNPNIIKFARRSLPDMDKYKCPECGIFLNGFFKPFRFNWEKPTSEKQFKEKALILKETISSYKWPTETLPVHEDWSLQDQYAASQKNVPPDVRNFLDYFRGMPKSENLQKDFDFALKECNFEEVEKTQGHWYCFDFETEERNHKLAQLEKFGIIKVFYMPKPFSEIAQEFVDSLHSSYNYVSETRSSCGWVCPFKEEMDAPPNYYLEDFRFFGSFNSQKEKLFFNKYIFDYPEKRKIGFI